MGEVEGGVMPRVDADHGGTQALRVQSTELLCLLARQDPLLGEVIDSYTSSTNARGVQARERMQEIWDREAGPYSRLVACNMLLTVGRPPAPGGIPDPLTYWE
eukprot:16434435-Heterocapsa_arctica.AAC.1